MLKTTFLCLAIASTSALAACGHSQSQAEPEAAATETEEEDRFARNSKKIQNRASFDLDCPDNQVEVLLIEEGTFMRPATFGARGCGKQATYLWRMGTIIRQ